MLWELYILLSVIIYLHICYGYYYIILMCLPDMFLLIQKYQILLVRSEKAG